MTAVLPQEKERQGTRMRKTIIYAILSALILTGTAMGVSAAESKVAYTPSATTVAPGGTFDVTVSFNGIENALGYAVMLDNAGWDSIVLDESGPAEAAETKAPLFAADPNDANDVAAAYLSATTLSGEYVKYTFTVPGDAEDGKVALTFTTKVLDAANAEISGSTEQTVEVAISSSSAGGLTIKSESGYTLDETTGYLTGVKEQTDVDTLLANFDNAAGTVRVMKGTSEITGTALVGTGCVVQIKIGDTWTDAATVVVKGDVTGDGKVNTADVAKLARYVNNSEKYPLSVVELAGSDVTGDGKNNTADIAKLARYVNNSEKYPL